MPVVHGFDPPDRFVVGTVGEPGARTFFLQARRDARLTSVALEKQQVAVLAERIDQLLDTLLADPDITAVIPAVAPEGSEDPAPLDQPIEEEFRAGTMTLSWDPDDERIVIEVFPLVGSEEIELDDDGDPVEPEPEEVFLVRVSAGAARAFVRRAVQVIEAGRPSCPFCGMPVSPEGHLCVRANGFRRREP
ncbi:MAG: DUF3090 domain-containing protein [Nocardioides sp.]|uniref:DUF3090 domain-containing protein n=1 Tax=Nocardioides sp. TaxID=35761 RepID=UPI0039E70033